MAATSATVSIPCLATSARLAGLAVAPLEGGGQVQRRLPIAAAPATSDSVCAGLAEAVTKAGLLVCGALAATRGGRRQVIRHRLVPACRAAVPSGCLAPRRRRHGGAANVHLTARKAITESERQILEEASEAGDPESQFLLGMALLQGDGVERDGPKAAELFEKAAEQGMSQAQYNLGMMYACGDGIETDPDKSTTWLRKAAESGEAFAQYVFGMMLLHGDGVKPEPSAALDFLRSAAEQGVSDAQYMVGKMLLETSPDAVEEKQWAAHWLSQAAQQDDVRAQYEISRMFFFGLGTERDLAKSANWASAAANKGHPEAQYMMGTMLLSGQGVEENREWSAYWFEQAAKQGHVDAMHNLALQLESGDGIPEDKDKAEFWFARAEAAEEQVQEPPGLQRSTGPA